MLKKLFGKLQKQTYKEYNESALMAVFARTPVCFVRGDGVSLWDDEGIQYLDALGGIAVTVLGHSHPEINKTISLQSAQLLHTSNLFHIREQAQLAEKFCQNAEMDKVFFCNSGAEANETALKIARLYGNNEGIKTPVVITAKQSFHGRTIATLSATGNVRLQKGFNPMLAEFIHVDYNNIDAIRQHTGNPDVVAVMMEPIQGEAGIIVPDKDYLKQVRMLCDDYGWLLILDEIQTGMGRTGSWFAYQNEDVLPDIMTSAKALGNGIPIGACAARGDAANVLTVGMHGSTFGGNPFACKVALATIEVIENEGLIDNAATVGAYLKKQLQQQIGTHERVLNIRGKGMMLAIELDHTYAGLAEKFLQQGLVVNITNEGKIIRLLPALILTEKQAKQIAEIIQYVITHL